MFASTASVDASAPLLGTGAPRDGRTASRATDRSGEAHRASPEDAEDASSFGRSAPRGPTPEATARSAARALLVGAASFALVALVVASVALAAAGGASAAPRASRGEGVTAIPSLREGEATPARGRVVVGFQSRGFYNYKATIRLLKQAFPDHDLVLVGQAVDAAALVDNDRVRRGHPGWPGDPGFPAYVDLVVEGPNVHRHIDGPRACGFQVGSNTGAWIQSIADIAVEMNAELNANLGDAQVAFPTPDASSQFPLPTPDASSQFPLRLALAVPLHRWAHSVDGGPVVADRPGVE